MDSEVINPELGTEKEFSELMDSVRELNMGWLQDIVPKHIAFDSENRMLIDVLEKGKAALFQRGEYFPLEIDGRLKENIITLAGKEGNSWAFSLAPRFFTSAKRKKNYPLGRDVRGNTFIRLPEGTPPLTLRDAITNDEIRCSGEVLVGDILKKFPAALLVSTDN